MVLDEKIKIHKEWVSFGKQPKQSVCSHHVGSRSASNYVDPNHA